MDPVLLRAWGRPVDPPDLFGIDGLKLYIVEGAKRQMLGFYGLLPREDILHVQTLILASSEQDQGLGTDIMRSIERQAKKAGYNALELCVQTTNPGAMRLYERLGFNSLGYIYISTLLMRKELR